MSSDLRETLLKLAAPAVGLVLVLIVARARGLSFRDDLGLATPPPKRLALWLGVFAVVILATEVIGRWLGLPAPSRWELPLAIALLRAFGIVVLAPLGEELIFRGALFSVLKKTRLGAAGAILIPAVFFAAIHTQYGLSEVALIFLDGALFGLARYHSGSVLVPVLMHAMGNLYAAIERMPA
jgi:membrane protease YdiL (CAAX protease family)